MTEREPVDETAPPTDEQSAADETVAKRLSGVGKNVSARRVLRLALTLVLIVIVATFVVAALPQVFGFDESFVVMSGSMEPEISAGDVVLVTDTSPENIEEGDVITFRTGTEYTTHRVIEVQREGGGVEFRTAGDANDNVDPEAVTEDQLVGKVAFAIPYIGHVVLFTNTPHGFVLLVFLPLMAFVSSQMWNVVRSTNHPDTDGDPPMDEQPTDITGDPSSGSTDNSPSDSPINVDELSSADAGSDSESGLSLTRTDITVSLVVTAMLAVYGGFIGYRTLSTPGNDAQVLIATAMVSVASVSGLVLLGGLLVFGGPDQSSEATQKPLDQMASLPTIAVGSFDELASIAAARGGQILKDPNTDSHYIIGDDALFVVADEPAPVEANGDGSSEEITINRLSPEQDSVSAELSTGMVEEDQNGGDNDD